MTLAGNVQHEARTAAASGSGRLHPFDLEERTAKFAEAVIRFCKKLPKNVVTLRIIAQLIDAAASVGANYCEADDAISKRDFRHRVSICRKEARESKYWLRLIATAHEPCKDDARTLWVEAKEPHLIFSKIFRRNSV